MSGTATPKLNRTKLVDEQVQVSRKPFETMWCLLSRRANFSSFELLGR